MSKCWKSEIFLSRMFKIEHWNFYVIVTGNKLLLDLKIALSSAPTDWSMRAKEAAFHQNIHPIQLECAKLVLSSEPAWSGALGTWRHAIQTNLQWLRYFLYAHNLVFNRQTNYTIFNIFLASKVLRWTSKIEIFL